MVTLEEALQTELPFMAVVSITDEPAFDHLLLHNSHYAVPIQVEEEKTGYYLVPIIQYVN